MVDGLMFCVIRYLRILCPRWQRGHRTFGYRLYASYVILLLMSRTPMPPLVHQLYVVGLVLIVLFVIVAWVLTAFSVSAKTISNLPDHNINMAAETCITCHRTNAHAPKIPHIEFPTCGYCHR
jgi:hypothetical protein